MATLVGVLVDVSGSMKSSIGERPNQKGGSWVRSIFNVVDGLTKHDVSSSNHVFALGFGAEKEPGSFDLLNTIAVNTKSSEDTHRKSKREILEEILGILERSGAPRVRTWGKMDVLENVVEKSDACSILRRLKDNSEFRSKFVDDCLPETCREVEIGNSARSVANKAIHETMFWGFWAVGKVPFVGDGAQNFASEDSVKDVVKKGKELLLECVTFKRVSPAAIIDVHRASKILHGGIGEKELTEKRIDELMETVEPFIYGRTPLMGTLKAAKDLFAMPKFEHYNKLLFILSDGHPSDGMDPPIKEMADLDVKTVCCYITDNAIDDPKRLYSTECESWDCAAKLMFKMSSTITTQTIPRTIFVKRGWNIDFANNETRLFVQVNHPDIIEDVCGLARDVVCCQEVLSDVLSSVSLDLYINQANDGFVPKEQVGGTCYANASAALLHLSMQRIVGREGGYPDFFDLRKEVIAKYGEHGANTLRVLKEVCPQYRLHCQEVDVLGAMKAITAKRPVLATFRLTDEEWDIFSVFYKRNRKGVLSSSILDRKRRRGGAKLSGHAVVLIGFNSESLRLMNSWSSRWADGGFFRVSDADVLGLRFVDVYWTKKNLKPSEIRAYDRRGATISQNLISKLKGLQTALYKCPLCRQTSEVVEFSGHHLEVVCPKCGKKFNTKTAGDDLALNLYLLSIAS